LNILKSRMNQTINAKQKALNHVEKLIVKMPRTRLQVKRKYMNDHVREHLKTDLRNLKRQKSNLQNLTTATLRNKIKRIKR